MTVNRRNGMRNTIDEMDRKIKDLEFENLRNHRY